MDPVVDRYNETVHVSTGVTPDVAAKEDPEVTQKLTDHFKAAQKTNMKYTAIKVGVSVKIRIKAGQLSAFKTGFKTWSTKIHTLTEKVATFSMQVDAGSHG